MDQEARDIRIGAEALGVRLSAVQAAVLAAHLEMLREATSVVNLTAVAPGDFVTRHVLDSLAGAPHLAGAPAGALADLGSGGGFPGIPLSVATGRHVDLVESVRKKASFLERVCADLRLDATVRGIRAEELASDDPAAHAAVTARAVSGLPSLLELASPLLVDEGLAICFKGAPDQEELRRAGAVARKVGMEIVEIAPVEVPGLDERRCVVVAKKTRASRIALPRRTGLAQKSPLD